MELVFDLESHRSSLTAGRQPCTHTRTTNRAGEASAPPRAAEPRRLDPPLLEGGLDRARASGQPACAQCALAPRRGHLLADLDLLVIVDELVGWHLRV